MRKIKVNHHGEEREFEVKKTYYLNNDNLALVLFDGDEQFGICTVNFEKLDQDHAYLDTNNFPGIEEALEDCGFFAFRDKRSGFCSYPLWIFDPCFLDQCEDMA